MEYLHENDSEIVSAMGYTRGDLKEAFDLIANDEHWKLEIDATIPQHMMTRCEEACMFFTGSVLQAVAYDEQGGTARVVAEGYYNAVGA